MRTEEFDYSLPPELIAQTPIEPRDSSRLLVVRRLDGTIRHRTFSDLTEFVQSGDLVVLNDSRVLPARLLGIRDRSGGACELLLLRDMGDERWLCLARPAKRMREGDTVSFGHGRLHATVEGELPDGQRVVRFAAAARPTMHMLDELGQVPLPPYIRRAQGDPERYQTVYSREVGSAAAPTAGLHFTQTLLDQLQSKGINIATVTLHVGLGTFRPVQAERVSDHVMHAEYGILPDSTVSLIAQTRSRQRRVIAVGTTVVRVLETAAALGTDTGWSGWTNIFIYPGHTFQAIDSMITNFHLPRSSLLMLVSAFAGKALVDRVYGEAIANGYRFFSFGDAMLIE